MNYFFYNTDSTAIKDTPRPRFGVLINRGFAAVGGDRNKFGEQLDQLSPGDVLLMYENKVGIVAIGNVLKNWDGITHSDPLYYTLREMGYLTGGANEYRIAVDWFIDLRDSPISVQQLIQRIGYNPRGTIQKIIKCRAEIETLIDEISLMQPSNYFPTKEDFESAYRQLTLPGKSISIDAVLDQIEFNSKNDGKFLSTDWRVITEKNIEVWAGGNRCVT